MDDCRHGQEHHHHHHHHIGLAEGITPAYVQKLRVVALLAFLYLVIQFVGSLLSGSLALMADAGHKLGDIAAILLALFAGWFAGLARSPRYTFGFHRLEIMAALVNATGLLVTACIILWEAKERFDHPVAHIEGGLMMGGAFLGLLINLLSARILYPARELNLNVKGALLHVIADILNSVGEMITAACIILFHIFWLDTIISVIIAALIFVNAARLLRTTLNILMESSPPHLNVAGIRDFIQRQPGVTEVHDLHVWTITTGKNALLAHVRVAQDAFRHDAAREMEQCLRDAFDLCHITIQLEPPGFQESTIPF